MYPPPKAERGGGYKKKKIKKKNILNKEKIKEINKKVKDKILKCVEFANESKYPKKEDIYKNVYSKEYSFLKF